MVAQRVFRCRNGNTFVAQGIGDVPHSLGRQLTRTQQQIEMLYQCVSVIGQPKLKPVVRHDVRAVGGGRIFGIAGQLRRSDPNASVQDGL